MGLINWFKKIVSGSDESDWEDEEEFYDSLNGEENEEGDEEVKFEPMRRSAINIHDADDREAYIRNCCQQMVEAKEEIDRATMEYRLVTNYLTDIEQIEKLPEELAQKVKATALRIVNLEKDTRERVIKGSKIPEEKYYIILKYEKEVLPDLERMRENEDYHSLIKLDLSKLESEKSVTEFRLNELRSTEKNDRQMAILTTVAAIMTALLLLVLHVVLRFNTSIGFILLCAAAAVSYTYLYVNFTDARAERRKKFRYLNAVIHKQNVVKIRYVNNSALLDYEYRKYHVNHSDELEYFLGEFQNERKARRMLEKADGELGEEKRHLVSLLRTMNLNDPNIWVSQCDAIVDSREMVEIRHDLNTRRQALRKRIEYNSQNMDISKNEITDIVKQYPEYGNEIGDIVAQYR